MIHFQCESCGKGIKVGDAAAGKDGKCPACGAAVRVPEALATAGPVPPPLKPVQRAAVMADDVPPTVDEPTEEPPAEVPQAEAAPARGPTSRLPMFVSDALGRLRGRKREVGIALVAFAVVIIFGLMLVFTRSASHEADAKLSAKEKDSRKAALRAARKLSSAVSVGVSYRSYKERLADAKADVDDALRDVSDGKFKEKVQGAMLAYNDASDLWTAAFQNEYVTVYLDTIKKLVDRYQLSFEYKNFRPQELQKVSDNGMTEILYVSAPLSKIWAIAEVCLNEAEKLASD